MVALHRAARSCRSRRSRRPSPRSWSTRCSTSSGRCKRPEVEAKILALAERAGIRGSRIYEVDKSRDTTTVNAYVTGLWGTKRIVLWDTIIRKLDEDELLVVMGHEMGHYVLNHVALGISLAALATLVGLLVVDRGWPAG